MLAFRMCQVFSRTRSPWLKLFATTKRARHGVDGLLVEHPVAGDEFRTIRRLLTARQDHLLWTFLSERKQTLGQQAVSYIAAEADHRGSPGLFNSHMLRHSCGFALVTRGCDLRPIQDYLGHYKPCSTGTIRFEGS